MGKVMIVCLTDGRANVSIKKSTGDPDSVGPDAVKVSQAEMKEEVLEMAGKLFSVGCSLLVIDTENKFLSTGFAKEVADKARGKYYYLPNADERTISATTMNALSEMRNQ